MQQLRVILADDDEVASISIGSLCKALGATCEKSLDGVECVEAYKKDPKVKCILMDLNMPNLDGIEATKEIRAFETKNKLGRVPIYGLSADDSQLQECKAAGMDDLLCKPITKAKLQKILS